MYGLAFYLKPDGGCPYEEYVAAVHGSGLKKEAAKIRAYVERLRQMGSRRLVAKRWAEKMNWSQQAAQYVLLNGFRKQSRRTPPGELDKAENLMAEHEAQRNKGER